MSCVDNQLQVEYKNGVAVYQACMVSFDCLPIAAIMNKQVCEAATSECSERRTCCRVCRLPWRIHCRESGQYTVYGSTGRVRACGSQSCGYFSKTVAVAVMCVCRQFFCVHGGISPSLQTIDDIK